MKSNGSKYGEVECRLDTCENMFTKRVHNQSFCSRECCRIYTNARILAQYHEKKNKVMTGRICASKTCGVILSKYNPGDLCSIHEKKAHIEKLKSWGWNVDDDGNILN